MRVVVVEVVEGGIAAVGARRGRQRRFGKSLHRDEEEEEEGRGEEGERDKRRKEGGENKNEWREKTKNHKMLTFGGSREWTGRIVVVAGRGALRAQA